MSRLIAIGDIHGCIDELKLLLEIAEVASDDRVICLGDLMDRGPDPVAVLRLVRARGFECILGNHEEKHVRWAKHESEARRTGKKNPMKSFTGTRLMQHQQLTDDEISWMASLPPFKRFEWEGRQWIASHAGLPWHESLERYDVKRLVRIRYLHRKTGAFVKVMPNEEPPPEAAYWSELWPDSESVIYGHIVHERVRKDICAGGATAIGLDTGCCFGGYLTAAIFHPGDEMPIHHSVKAAREYHSRLRPGSYEEEEQ